MLNVIRFVGFYGIKEKIKLITIVIITIVVIIIIIVIIKIQVFAYNVINNYHNNKFNNIHVLILLKKYNQAVKIIKQYGVLMII